MPDVNDGVTREWGTYRFMEVPPRTKFSTAIKYGSRSEKGKNADVKENK